MMLDKGGRFMLLISRPDLPKFAAGKRDAGEPSGLGPSGCVVLSP